MDDITYAHILQTVAEGMTQTQACYSVDISPATLLSYLARHEHGDIFQATLLQAEGDARIVKADEVRQQLSDRIDQNIIREDRLVKAEHQQINKLRREGFEMRDRSDKQINDIRKAEKKRVAEASAPAKPRSTGSWADSIIAREQSNITMCASSLPPTEDLTPTPEIKPFARLSPPMESQSVTPRVTAEQPNQSVPTLAPVAPQPMDNAANEMSKAERLAASTGPEVTSSIRTVLFEASRAQSQTDKVHRTQGQEIEPINGQQPSLLPSNIGRSNQGSWIL